MRKRKVECIRGATKGRKDGVVGASVPIDEGNIVKRSYLNT